MSSSRSSSDGREGPLLLGRVAGHRGRGGEVTVRVASGDASRWTELTTVLVSGPGGEPPVPRAVAGARGYRDRLVLRLEGVDGAEAAEALKGWTVWAPRDQAAALPEGTWYAADLEGLAAVGEDGADLGRVAEVQETGGTDLLVLREPGGEEVLVPLARDFVVAVEIENGRIVLRLPPELQDLNRGGA